MVKVYAISVRYQDGNGHQYTILGYFLSKSKAILEAHKYFNKRGSLSKADKIIVQELNITSDGSKIELVDWINY